METFIREKGKSIIDFPQDYILIDIETTGLSTEWDEIIEIAALKIHQDEILDVFSTLVKPNFEIDEFITELTGITNGELKNAPKLTNVLPLLKDFISSSLLVGHNVNFDVNFLYDAFLGHMGYKMDNDYIDTLRIARKVLPDLKHHRLDDLISHYSITDRGLHRALSDCEKTFSIFQFLKDDALSKFNSIDDFKRSFNRKNHSKSYSEIFKSLKSETSVFDESHPIYNKICVFTGTLEKMSRKEAAQLVINIGGICKNSITKDTNFLILGNTDYSKNIKDGKSNKQKKAEQLILSGQDLIILPESEFYELISQE